MICLEKGVRETTNYQRKKRRLTTVDSKTGKTLNRVQRTPTAEMGVMCSHALAAEPACGL